MDQPYPVCLKWNEGRSSEKVELTADLTVSDVFVMARERTGFSSLQIATGFPVREPLDDATSHETARDVIPKRSVLYCSSVAAAAAPADDSVVVVAGSKKRSRSEEQESNLIDLTTTTKQKKKTTAEDDDVAFALRLQAEYDAEAAAAANHAAVVPDYAAAPAKNGDDVDPTTVVDGGFWIYKYGPQPYCRETPLGKWCVYRSESQINEVWQKVWPAVVSGHLGSVAAKVATKRGNNGSPSYVICVYASEARMDDVGKKLIQIVKQKMSFKTDEATREGIYSNNSKNVSLKQLYWHNGRPTFTRPPKMKPETSRALAKKAASNNHNELTLSFEIEVTLTGMAHYEVSKEEKLVGVTQVVLNREPGNANDHNAIRVNLRNGDKKIGYVLAKNHAALLAPWMDKKLLRIDSAVMHREVGKSTMVLLVTGFACEDAQAMLSTLSPTSDIEE